MKSPFQEYFYKECQAKVAEQLKIKNPNRVPRLAKVVVAASPNEVVANSKALDLAIAEIALITGQKPIVTRAKKAISNFKVREGMPLGCKVTLRRARMYEFVNRLFNVALPRMRDFKGVSPKGFDGRGNYTLGITEQIVFPEIPFDKVDKVRGMNITMVTTGKTDEEARALLEVLGMPFRKPQGDK